MFTKPSQLRLHINIHYFERPFRCEACAVSFRTKGHLQKHKRSVTHFNKVNMNLTFGTPSSENPRPFKCSDCMIAFRIHGHLAKHLRSKMHIMKLECLGKLPFGTYAEMERSGVNLNEIDTTDCHNSLESLQSLAHRLYKQDPSKLQQWHQEVLLPSVGSIFEERPTEHPPRAQAQSAAERTLRERTVSGSSEEFSDVADIDADDMDEEGEDSDGLPDAVDSHPPPAQPVRPVTSSLPSSIWFHQSRRWQRETQQFDVVLSSMSLCFYSRRRPDRFRRRFRRRRRQQQRHLRGGTKRSRRPRPTPPATSARRRRRRTTRRRRRRRRRPCSVRRAVRPAPAMRPSRCTSWRSTAIRRFRHRRRRRRVRRRPLLPSRRPSRRRRRRWTNRHRRCATWNRPGQFQLIYVGNVRFDVIRC